MVRFFLFYFFIISNASFCQVHRKSPPLISDDKVNLYAFIGRRISITAFNPNANYKEPLKVEIDSTTNDTVLYRREYIMDYGFEGKYELIENVFNTLKLDTVTFKAYDHYGRPAFEKYDTVLLYISKVENENSYFHQKYQFDPVHKRRNGKWVGQYGESLKKLFKKKKQTIFKARGLFKD